LDVPISLSQALLGGTVQVPTLEGIVEVKIPAGTQTNDKSLIRGKGIKRLNQSQQGHQFLHYKIRMPT
jgi:molecular chaperone DnaJ